MAEQLTRELRVFHELARVVAAGPYEVGDVLERMCSEIRAAFAFERALIVRYRPGDETVHAVVQQGVEWPGDEWLPLSMFALLARALETGAAVATEDPIGDALLPERIAERFGVGPILSVPLLIEGRCLGFLVADRAGRSLDLTTRDLELLTTLAFVAAVFIDKADRYAQLQEALEELRQLDDAKSDFISIASHELRTPIAVVSGIAATLHLRGQELREEQLIELRATLHEQSQRLQMLTNQLLDLSRIDTGEVSVAAQPVRPRELCDALLPQLAPDRLADIEVTIDPLLEVKTDPTYLERVLANLITNALRYGRPPVYVRGDANGAVRLVVEDRGPGVDPSFVPLLYDRFTRSEHSRALASTGAGLGLAIARSFAEALGGELSYSEANPHGACFTLTLPRM